MKPKLKSIIVILLLIFSTFVLILDLNPTATIFNEDTTPQSPLNQNNRLGRGGFDWGPIMPLSEPILGQDKNKANSEYAKIAVEGNKIYVVWQDENNTDGAGTDSDIFFKYFDGNDWSKAQIISEPVPGDNINWPDSLYPDIAVENGKIYVVWADSNDTNGAGTDLDIFYRCNLTGNNWEDLQIISEPVFGNNFNDGASYSPEIAVENNNIFIVWSDTTNIDNSGAEADIFYRCNLSGANWEDIQVISEPIFGSNINWGDSQFPAIAVNSNKIYVVWFDTNNTNGAGTDSDIFYRCNLTSNSWEKIQVISEPAVGKNFNNVWSYRPDIAAENNKIYVVWYDYNNTNGAGWDADIFFRCNLTSNYWEKTQVISEPEMGNDTNTYASRSPTISVENNRIYVVWQDENDTNGAGGDLDIFHRCNYTGIYWEDIQIISEPIFGADINIGISEISDIAVYLGKSHIVWQDENNTNNSGIDKDIFYKNIFSPLVLSNLSVQPISGNTSTYFNFTVTYNNIDNKAPTQIIVTIDGIDFSMLEVDPNDVNFLNGKDYFYKKTNLDIGLHTYRLQASDGEKTRFTRFINKPKVYNTPPKITTINNLTAFENEYYEVIYEYEDIDVVNVGQSIYWNCSTNATWLVFDSIIAKLNGTPTKDNLGEYWVNITLNDTIDISHTNFTLTVLNVNDNPVINTTNIEITYEDDLYEIDYNATDVDSLIENQIWSLDTNASSWLDLHSGTGLLSGIPINDDIGEYWLNITVTDGDKGSDFTNFTLTVLNVNDPPEITTEDILVAPVNKFYEVDYNATDIDSPLAQLTWTLNTVAAWLAIEPVTGILSGTPTNSDVGWFNVNITVEDGDGGQDWREFVVTVAQGNLPPKIITDDVTTAIVAELYAVDYDATDPNTPLDKLIWTLETNASWLIIEKNLGILTGTPKLGDIGWYWVNVTVTDDEGAFDFHNFNLNVYLTSNQPPEIITEALAVAEVGTKYFVDYNATDDRTPEANLRWYLKSNASWLYLNLYTGELRGMPTINDIGSYWVEVSVFDTEDGWDRQNFTLRVLKEPEPEPEAKIKLTNPTLTPSEGTTETDFTFSIHYYNPENPVIVIVQLIIDADIYDMILLPGEARTNGTYTITLKLSEGVHTYYFVASDGPTIVMTEDYPTPDVAKVGGKDSTDKTSWDWLIWVIAIIIVIIILLLILLKKKQPIEELAHEAPSAEAPALAPPPQPVIAPTLAPTAAVTPQVVPHVVQPAPTLADVEEAEE
ncbi:MAG: hypothetical protein KAJ51_03050 [Thermoplasmata archaeon]|nr:hypothetical protein [Thermoplasmata archaeon]